MLEKLRAESHRSRRTAELIAQQERGHAACWICSTGLRGGRREPGAHERLEIMVSKQSVKGGHALVIDLTKCVRCNACVESRRARRPRAAFVEDWQPRLAQKTLASALSLRDLRGMMARVTARSGAICALDRVHLGQQRRLHGVRDGSSVQRDPLTPPPDRTAAPRRLTRRDAALIGHWFRSRGARRKRDAKRRRCAAEAVQQGHGQGRNGLRQGDQGRPVRGNALRVSTTVRAPRSCASRPRTSSRPQRPMAAIILKIGKKTSRPTRDVSIGTCSACIARSTIRPPRLHA